MLSGNLVCGFLRISGRDEPRVFLFTAATAPRIDFVYVHVSHDEVSLDERFYGKTGRKAVTPVTIRSNPTSAR